MRNLLAVLISGNLSSLMLTLYLTNDYNNFVDYLFFNFVIILLGHFLYAFPFSFLVEKLSNRFVDGKFFIGYGVYLVIAVLGVVILTPFIIFYSFYLLLVAIVFPITFEIIKKVPDRYVGKSVILASLLTFLLWLSMYYSLL
ncbi:hypothetical protein SAMN04487936_11122 [Halobacillus dabanensis]|uniref:Uncharacterized protein n=1 Tax=Halobacillus dabanensis TaxID=240302 RepID=A0A1I3YIG5_HALDA|nr:hypothetical protein SAMN04487936_11122 [Halobacillus dabanensis]